MGWFSRGERRSPQPEAPQTPDAHTFDPNKFFSEGADTKSSSRIDQEQTTYGFLKHVDLVNHVADKEYHDKVVGHIRKYIVDVENLSDDAQRILSAQIRKLNSPDPIDSLTAAQIQQDIMDGLALPGKDALAA